MKTGLSSLTKSQKRLHDDLAEMGCAVSKFVFGHDETPAEIHHILDGGRRISHWHVIPLAPIFHRQGTKEYPSIHSVNGSHGGRKAFEAAYGVTELELMERCEEWLDRLYSGENV